jgi:hypothetical protein
MRVIGFVSAVAILLASVTAASACPMQTAGKSSDVYASTNSSGHYEQSKPQSSGEPRS